MEITSKTACFTFLVFSLVAIKVTGRVLRCDSSELVADGIDAFDQNGESPFLFMKGMHYVSDECEHLYGFLPCADNLLGNLFLVLVYEYLLFRGEAYVAFGSEQIFKILGPGIFGASAFHVLGSLPEALILLGTHVFSHLVFRYGWFD